MPREGQEQQRSRTMDRNALLSQFIEETKLDPALAQDLLRGKNWKYEEALKDSRVLQGQRRLSVQNQAPHRGSPPQNFRAAQPLQGKTPSRVNGQEAPYTMQNGVGKSPNSLQNPPITDAPKSPATSKRLTRGLSTANARLVDHNRQKIIDDEKMHDYQLVETPRYTFILPDLGMFPPDFRAFVEKDLIDHCTMVNLENSGHLNWWAKTGACPKLWPMTTSGDGNCLLHASSLGMWGFHDRQLTLRKALYKDLTEHQHTAHMQKLKRRWRWQQTLANKESGLVFSEEEWEREWKALLKLASTVPRNHRYKNDTHKPTGGGTLPSLAEDQAYVEDGEEIMYESLEEFHVFVLCHILRRPIIIVADTVLRDAHGQPLAPIPFGGIYLPVEFHPAECHRSPLVLTYDASHFSALVPMEMDTHRDPESQKKPPVIPITDSNHQLLMLHFIVDPGIGWEWKDENHNTTKNDSSRKLVYSPEDKVQLLRKYLDLVRLDIPEASLESQCDEWELLPPKENGVKMVKVEVTRSNSSGSEKSDKSSGKEKSKSFGKKLKHFAGLDKSKRISRKNDQLQVTEGNRVTKELAASITDVVDRSVVVAARMDDIRLHGHEEMIRNYLEATKARYEEHIALKRMVIAEENRERQQRIQRSEHQTPELFMDDDERTNETAYNFSTIPRARLTKPMSSVPRSVPIRRDYHDGGQVRNVQYMNGAVPGLGTQTRSHPGSPAMERIERSAASYNPAVQHKGSYSPQPARIGHASRYQPEGHQYQQRSVPIQSLHIDDRTKENHSNSYGTYVRGKHVPLSKEEQDSRPCRTYGCNFFGSKQTDHLCSKCYESIMKKTYSSMR